MNPVTFSRKSLHWRLATVYGNLDEFNYSPEYRGQYPGNICDYIKAVVKGCFAVIAIIASCSVIGWPLAKMIAWIVSMCVMGTVSEVPGSAQIVGAVFILLGVYAAVKLILRLVTKSSTAVKKTSFAKAVFQKFKDKTCVKVIAE